MKKTLITILATVLVCCFAVGGTLAWLMDKTDTITNTFTVGNIDLSLEETTGSAYKMIPGGTITKDPVVTVGVGSEDCYVFIKIVETDTKNFLTYTLDGWTAVDGAAGVYYREHSRSDSAVEYKVFVNDTVNVSEDLTKEDTAELSITITAYAVQKSGFATVAAAWAEAQTLD